MIFVISVKAGRQMASITPCNQTQDADDPKQLE